MPENTLPQLKCPVCGSTNLAKDGDFMMCMYCTHVFKAIEASFRCEKICGSLSFKACLGRQISKDSWWAKYDECETCALGALIAGFFGKKKAPISKKKGVSHKTKRGASPYSHHYVASGGNV